MCRTFSLDSHSSKLSSFFNRSTSLCSPDLTCTTWDDMDSLWSLLLSGCNKDEVSVSSGREILVLEIGNSPEGHDWVGLRNSTSTFDFRATEVDIISCSDMRGRPGVNSRSTRRGCGVTVDAAGSSDDPKRPGGLLTPALSLSRFTISCG